jgi:diaminohydroxyphosphoribosylaminopyrimidine deaminase/5-amino-6-(5-phosphoribosylamino)uracil reductase
MQNHEHHMRLALDLAAKAIGMTSPNPMVGAVIVQDDVQIIAEGWHRRAGLPHAEAVALKLAGDSARGSTLYVTLEPCCHTAKKTPPCADAIIAAGVKRVVAAMSDPNPLVSGRGFRRLRSAGIEVVKGVLEREARELNRFFIRHITTGLPYVTMKTAQSIDGRIATSAGESKWITGPAARKIVHAMRAEHDAIMVGIGTVKADNPSLTVRGVRGRNPVRVIVDGRLEISPDSKVIADGLAPTIIATAAPPDHPKVSALARDGVELIHCAGNVNGTGGRVDLEALMRALGSRGIMSVLLEGGGAINGAMVRAGLVSRAVFFTAPLIIGGRNSVPSVGGPDIASLSDAVRLGSFSVTPAGRDIMISADILI